MDPKARGHVDLVTEKNKKPKPKQTNKQQQQKKKRHINMTYVSEHRTNPQGTESINNELSIVVF